MTHRSLAIRLAVVDGGKVKAELRDVGDTGQRALSRIEDASRPASKALQALDGVTGEVRAGLEGMAARLGPVGSGLSRIGPAGLAAAAATVGVGAAIKVGFREAAEADRSYRRLEAVLKATGFASGLDGTTDCIIRRGRRTLDIGDGGSRPGRGICSRHCLTTDRVEIHPSFMHAGDRRTHANSSEDVHEVETLCPLDIGTAIDPAPPDTRTCSAASTLPTSQDLSGWVSASIVNRNPAEFQQYGRWSRYDADSE